MRRRTMMIAQKVLEVQNDYRFCEEIIKEQSKSFYFAFKGLPEDKANAVFAIYAFCRRADDCVDNNDTKAKRLRALNKLEKELKLFEEKKELNHPMWRALRDVFNRYDMDIRPFYQQLRGQRMDIDFEQPNTLCHLEVYSFYVAGTVGQMLLPVIAQKHKEYLKEQAVNLGIAMQITNILRDIGEDYQLKKRIYLPVKIMNKEGYQEANLELAIINEQFIEIWESLAQHAEELYDYFDSSIDYFDEDSRFQIMLSARIYRGILQAVRNNQYDCFHTRNFVSPVEMQKIYQSTQLAITKKVHSR